MKKFYFLAKAFAISIPLIAAQFMNAQVYEVAQNDLYYAGGVSDNGIVSLYAGNAIYKWDKENGLQLIGSITNGAPLAGNVIINSSGTKITAGITNPETSLNEIALYDIASGEWSFKGGLAGDLDGSKSSAWGISEDGSIIVGLGWYEGATAHGVKWDAENGMVDLGSTVSGRSSRANDISADKTTIVGWQDQADGFRSAVRWVNGVQEPLLDGNGNFIGEAGAVSADGKVATGTNGLYAYRWSETEGYQNITHPNSGPFFRGGSTAVSADGNTVVGYFRSWPGAPMMGEGFIWTPENGRQNLNDYVTSLGLDTKGINFGLPLAMSSDGKKITGIGINSSNVVTAFYIDLTDVLATQNVTKSAISVYPNPAKDIITIAGADKVESVEVYNMVGQKVKALDASTKINVSSLTKGVYMLQITVKGQKQSIKFIKE